MANIKKQKKVIYTVHEFASINGHISQYKELEKNIDNLVEKKKLLNKFIHRQIILKIIVKANFNIILKQVNNLPSNLTTTCLSERLKQIFKIDIIDLESPDFIIDMDCLIDALTEIKDYFITSVLEIIEKIINKLMDIHYLI